MTSVTRRVARIFFFLGGGGDAIKLKLFGTTFYDTGNFNVRRRREALGGFGGMSARKF